MVLKLVKQLSPEIATKLRQASEAEKKFLLLSDGQFLFYAYANYLKNFKPKKGEILATSIVKKLGVFAFPLGGLRLCDNRVTFDTHLGVKINEKITEGEIVFDCGKHNYNTGLSLQLNDITHGIVFWERETLYSPWFLDFVNGEEQLGRGNILDMAVNFYNIRPIYQKIHRILLKDKSEYEKNFGEVFVEGLTLLFSATRGTKKASPFVLTQGYLSETFVKHIKRKHYLPIGLHYYTREETWGWVHTGNEIELFLDARNRLTIVISHPKHADNSPFLVSEDNKEFKDFLEDNLSTWLNQIISMADFCNKIFEKVKLKLFLENI